MESYVLAICATTHPSDRRAMNSPDRESPDDRWTRLHLPERRLSRRDLLTKCAALGVLAVVPSLSLADALDAWERQQARQPTPWNELGPFYRKGAPRTTRLRTTGDRGMRLSVSGRVFDTRGDVLPGATLEIWHTNDAGQYDLSGYHYRTSLVADNTGSYAFESIMPGHYPARVCQ